MIYKVMSIWFKGREKICHDYSLVGFFLSPNPVNITEAAENNTKEHWKSIKILFSKMFLDPTLVGKARVEARSDIFETFWKQYSDFIFRKKEICSPYMWVIAESLDILVHEWHNTYSVGSTKLLGNLACIVT